MTGAREPGVPAPGPRLQNGEIDQHLRRGGRGEAHGELAGAPDADVPRGVAGAGGAAVDAGTAVQLGVGPDIALNAAWNVRAKMPTHEETTVPWHQDNSYWEPRIWNERVLTVWFLLRQAGWEGRALLWQSFWSEWWLCCCK